jgi:LmbE family N-acetylglucosaminyl deacetylase
VSAVVFVSPHLDDVALSCPGHVLAERARGAHVIVATLFTDGARAGERQREDAAALALLDAEPLHLGLRDAPERRGHAAGFRALVLEARDRDAEDARAAAAAIAPLARNAERIYFPLGVGGHVDHRLAFDASLGLASCRYYEERPYADVRGAAGARLRELGVASAACSVAEYRAALEAAPFLRAYLPAGAERDGCLDELVARFERPPAPPLLALAAETVRFDAATVARARAAMCAYRSQLDDLFGGEPALDAATYHERLWRR